MFIKRSTLTVMTLVILLFFWKVLGLSYVVSAFPTLGIVVVGYVILVLHKQKNRMILLEELLDPEAFIVATEEQRKTVGKNKKTNAHLDVDIAAALISMGNLEEARDILVSIDTKYLSKIEGPLLVYNYNLMLVLYDLGETDEAEHIYRKEFKNLQTKGPRKKLIMELVEANKNYNSGNYDESKRIYTAFLDKSKSKRMLLGILYILAEIDEKQGNINGAKEKYEKVAVEGNKLFIRQEAKQKLSELDNN